MNVYEQLFGLEELPRVEFDRRHRPIDPESVARETGNRAHVSFDWSDIDDDDHVEVVELDVAGAIGLGDLPSVIGVRPGPARRRSAPSTTHLRLVDPGFVGSSPLDDGEEDGLEPNRRRVSPFLRWSVIPLAAASIVAVLVTVALNRPEPATDVEPTSPSVVVSTTSEPLPVPVVERITATGSGTTWTFTADASQCQTRERWVISGPTSFTLDSGDVGWHCYDAPHSTRSRELSPGAYQITLSLFAGDVETSRTIPHVVVAPSVTSSRGPVAGDCTVGGGDCFWITIEVAGFEPGAHRYRCFGGAAVAGRSYEGTLVVGADGKGSASTDGVCFAGTSADADIDVQNGDRWVDDTSDW